MKLTNRSEYALLALVFLARNYEKGLASADEISIEQEIPKRFLQQILFGLKQAGYIHSVKGQEGGYKLAKAPKKITIAEIVRHFEGPLAPSKSVSKNFYQPTPIEKEPGIVKLFLEIRNQVAELLEATTLADLLSSRSK